MGNTLCSASGQSLDGMDEQRCDLSSHPRLLRPG